MLHRLLIRNYAIIDELTIDYCSKLNIVTGETGAGKSIVMGALQLILGQRADSSAVLPDKKCIVEGVFSGGDQELIADFVRRQDLDLSDEWVLRREISSNGKSRSFINDTPVNLSQLKEMALLLVDLHQQFDTQELGEEDFQRSVLDSLAGNNKRLSHFYNLYDTYLNRRHDLDRMKAEKELAAKEADYHRFLFDELDGLSFRENELEELEAESRMLEHAEGIMQDLSFINKHLSAGSEPLIQQLRTIQSKMDQVASLLPAASVRALRAPLTTAAQRSRRSQRRADNDIRFATPYMAPTVATTITSPAAVERACRPSPRACNEARPDPSTAREKAWCT